MFVVRSSGAGIIRVFLSIFIVMICEVWPGGDAVTAIKADNEEFGTNL